MERVWSLFFEIPNAALKRKAIFQHFPGYLGAGNNTWRTTPVGIIQSGDWKLMEFFEDHRLELYDLKGDIGETQNLATVQSERAKELHAEMIAWRERVGAKMPTPNTPVEAAEKMKGKGKGKGKGKKKKNAEDPSGV